MIPISVIVCVKNEEKRVAACLSALAGFDEIVVVDSYSIDGTIAIVKEFDVRIEQFSWNGCYPKKYQWTLDYLELKHERILFVDADEIVTPQLKTEITALDWTCDGYFIRGRPVWHGRPLGRGMWNNKLALFDRRKFRFPEINDLDIPGGNELEGHYQPVGMGRVNIGQLRGAILHDCQQGWPERHQKYAFWEAEMMQRNAFPADPVRHRQIMKQIFRAMPLRDLSMFVYGYGWKLGFLDGRAGFDYARAKARYYRDISVARKKQAADS